MPSGDELDALADHINDVLERGTPAQRKALIKQLVHEIQIGESSGNSTPDRPGAAGADKRSWIGHLVVFTGLASEEEAIFLH